ncbi:PorT family protein [Olivibacter sp. SDN3]|uniref:porin family protein n=1 Tax=Olivibacter sp. SDN3 TaxID=2764720 RepID=UPI0016518254|nr:porin family protein [Olivibacter sp. SDN3]QNL50135.1 PorT family protein [Olivibacter sp. SDN3]
MKILKLLAVISGVFFCAGNHIAAQTENLTFGVKAGANYTNLYAGHNEVNEEKGKVGFTVGAFGRIGQTLFFQPEINYTRFSSEFIFQGEKFNPKFNQLNVPLMIGYKLIDDAQMNIRVSIGPDFSYSLNKPIEINGTEYERFNMGGVFNVGVDLGSITLDARYNRGFTKFNELLEQRTGMYTLTVGFRIL